MSHSVGELAKLTGVSVRTLHHYDEIGLLTPSERTESGYRRYGDAEVERLHRILVYRELGFDLAGIARILDDEQVDVADQLEWQRELLAEQVARLTRMIQGLEKIMTSKKSGLKLTSAEVKEVFGDFDPAEHADEARERWGSTDAYKESQRRVSRYGKEQWLEIRTEAERINAEFVSTMSAGTAPTDVAAMDLAEEHRRHISRWFYDCTYEIHRGLGEMYVADSRFAKHYEDQAAGLSMYVRDAISANAERGERR